MTRGSMKLCLVAEGPNKVLADLKQLAEAGMLFPIVDTSYRLSEAAEA